MITVTQNLKEVVHYYLAKYPKLRDSDEHLVAIIWHNQISKNKDLSVVQFLKLYADGCLTNSDSITRMRRKLQEHHPELRGDLWIQRHEKQEEIVQNLNDVI